MTTRLVVGIAAVVVAGALIAAVVVPRLNSAPVPETDTSDPGLSAPPDARPDRPLVDRPGAAAGALDRLRAELEHAPPVEINERDERLAAAIAWVEAHRDPDRPYNELEARVLALLAAAEDDRSALWAINTSLIEVETLRALDTDADGVLSAEEIAQFLADPTAVPDPLDHPYFEGGLDTQASLVAVLERARLDAWDTDADGFLSTEERDRGRAIEHEARLDRLVRHELNRLEIAGAFEEASPTREDAETELRARLEASLAGADAAMITAEPLLQAMRMEDLSDDAVRADLTASIPTPPDLFSFDANGDGEMDTVETTAWTNALAEFDQAVLAMREDADASFLRRRFQLAASQGDRDGDGRFTPEEWGAYIDRLIAERDRRLFQRSYDLDRDGTVGDRELIAFLDWHKAGSPRADANFDGVVDVRDLEHVRRHYTQSAPEQSRRE